VHCGEHLRLTSVSRPWLSSQGVQSPTLLFWLKINILPCNCLLFRPPYMGKWKPRTSRGKKKNKKRTNADRDKQRTVWALAERKTKQQLASEAKKAAKQAAIHSATAAGSADPAPAEPEPEHWSPIVAPSSPVETTEEYLKAWGQERLNVVQDRVIARRALTSVEPKAEPKPKRPLPKPLPRRAFKRAKHRLQRIRPAVTEAVSDPYESQ
jgi:hypothetical protein